MKREHQWIERNGGCFQSPYRRLEDGLFSLWQISLICIVSSVSSQWMNKHAAVHTLESSPKKDRIVDGRSCWFLKTDLFQAIPPPSEPCQIKQGLCCHKCRTRADCKLCLEWKDIFDSYAGKSSWACVVGPQGWAVVFGHSGKFPSDSNCMEMEWCECWFHSIWPSQKLLKLTKPILFTTSRSAQSHGFAYSYDCSQRIRIRINYRCDMAMNQEGNIGIWKRLKK